MMKKQLFFCASKCQGKYDGLRAFITHEVGVQICKNIDNYHQRTFCPGKMAPRTPKFGLKFAKQTLSLQNQDEYIRTICAFLRLLGHSKECTHGQEIQYGFVSPIPAKWQMDSLKKELFLKTKQNKTTAFRSSRSCRRVVVDVQISVGNFKQWCKYITQI